MLWRHGRTEWNATSRFQGQSDVPLDALGLSQAESAATVLAAAGIHRIVSSDLIRARVTAEVLGGLAGLTVVTDPELRETHSGRWEGLTHEEIRTADGEVFERWRTDHTIPAGTTGETREQVGARMAHAVRRHADTLDSEQTLVVVTHGGAARAGITRLLGWPITFGHTLHVLENCAWAVLAPTFNGPWHLVAYNRVPV